ncbi:MAG: hypothetical protein ACE3L7_01260 [Candidatus Pristimantibacillus sp.]
MLKNRIFLTGLGIGIIVGALLLQLMSLGEQSQLKLKASLNKDEEVLFTQKEVDAMLDAERVSMGLNAKVDAESKTEVTTETDKQDEVKEDAAAESEQPEQNANSEEGQPAAEVAPKETRLHIKGGMNLTSIAKLLAENDIISDQAEFIKQMNKTKKPVRAGHFVFSGQPTLKEVMTIITTKP